MVGGRRGLCGLTAQRPVVMECRSELTPASTPRLGTTGLTATDRREKRRSATLLPVLVCFQASCSRCSCHDVACRHSSGPLPQLMFAVVFDALLSDDLCPWSPWSACSQSCGAGSVSRRRTCVCDTEGEAECPANMEAERSRQETQLCYKQPCPSTSRSPPCTFCPLPSPGNKMLFSDNFDAPLHHVIPHLRCVAGSSAKRASHSVSLSHIVPFQSVLFDGSPTVTGPGHEAPEYWNAFISVCGASNGPITAFETTQLSDVLSVNLFKNLLRKKDAFFTFQHFFRVLLIEAATVQKVSRLRRISVCSHVSNKDLSVFTATC